MRTATLEDYKQRILRVMLHVQEHLDEPLDLTALAAVAAFSPCHFHRIFRGMVGESVDGYVRRLRLERAASALKTTDRPILDLALEAGYSTHEAFTRAFRDSLGNSPSGFRRAHGGDREPPAEADRTELDPRQPDDPALEVTILSIDPLRVAFSRHIGPYDECGPTWDRLLTWAGSHGLVGAGTRFIGVCHDDPGITPAHRVRYDACITIDREVEPAGEFGIQTIASGPYAVTTHHGPYGELDRTYVRLVGQWAPRSGRALRSLPCVEIYLNSPESTEPEDLLTDVLLPLEP
jgi:AraC family transcriptional regulator